MWFYSMCNNENDKLVRKIECWDLGDFKRGRVKITQGARVRST